METTQQTGIHHLDGTLSMARDTPNSATSSFSICVNDQPELDFAGKRNPDGQGFAAFGRVTKGMKVVRKIQEQRDKDQYLVNPVKIYTIKRL
jgi:peptidyl-prolyl cis-trans isomerase A (cyclophilin A)